MSHSFSSTALVLKRRTLGETDRLVGLLTQDLGKLTVVAKGVRKLGSSNRANLEPGNLIQAFMIETKGLPILTQTRLQIDASQVYQDLDRHLALKKISHLQQILEIFDRLFVENFIDEGSFALALKIHNLTLKPDNQAGKIKLLLNQLLQLLGYQDLKETSHQNIADYVAEISEKKLKSYEFLKNQS